MKKILIMMISILCCFSLFAKKAQKVEAVKINYDEELIKAMDEQNYDYVLECLDKGANPDTLYNNRSLLYYSVFNELIQIGLKCIEKGCDVNWENDYNENAFSGCIFKNNDILAEAIFENGLNINYKDSYNKNLIEICIYYKNYKWAYKFLEYDELKQECLVKYDNILLFLIMYWTDETAAFIEALFGKDYVYPDDCPVLFYSAGHQNMEAINFFIEHGVDKYKKYYDIYDKKYYTTAEYLDTCIWGWMREIDDLEAYKKNPRIYGQETVDEESINAEIKEIQDKIETYNKLKIFFTNPDDLEKNNIKEKIKRMKK